jgi:hypothetical protein
MLAERPTKLAAAIANASDLTPDDARDAYVRLAAWYEDKRKVGPRRRGARSALTRDREPRDSTLHRAHPPSPGRERDLVKSLRRLAELELDPSANDSSSAAKVLAEEHEGPVLTEEVLRQLLDEDEANLWALEELTRLREAASAFDENVQAAAPPGRASTDGLEIAKLPARRGNIAIKSAAMQRRHRALRNDHREQPRRRPGRRRFASSTPRTIRTASSGAFSRVSST